MIILYPRRKLSCTMMYGVWKYVNYMYHTKIVMCNDLTFLYRKVLCTLLYENMIFNVPHESCYVTIRKSDVSQESCQIQYACKFLCPMWNLCKMMYENVIIFVPQESCHIQYVCVVLCPHENYYVQWCMTMS